jgi:hypothetical protein
MGMDVMGINPINTDGETFHANLWSWRPIHYLCDYLNMKHNLNFDMSRWGYNDGSGLNAKDCMKMADKLERHIKDHPFLKSDDDRMYVCLGMWIDTNTNQSIRPQGISVQYPNGTILYSSVVTKAGDVVEASHSVTLGHLKRFISFLKVCGGFQIF